MSQKQKRMTYFVIFLTLLGVEIVIGVFAHDRFIRPYVGDALVIGLLCAFARIFFPGKPVGLGLYMILVGAGVELLQLAHLDVLLHIQGTLLGVILGATFDVYDLISYAVGGVLFFIGERVCGALNAVERKNNRCGRKKEHA